MAYKKEFLQNAVNLINEGYLKSPKNLVSFQDQTLYSIADNTDLETIQLKDIHTTPVASLNQDTSPFFFYYQIFLKKRANCILLSQKAFTKTAALAGKTIYPMLDDMAQLIGPTVRAVQNTDKRIINGINNRNAVLLKEIGGLCIADSLYDLYAVAMILEKACRVTIESFFLGGGKKINYAESLIMRWMYLQKYSKIAKKK